MSTFFHSRPLLFFALMVIALTATTCQAGFVVLDGNNPEPNQENALLVSDSVGLTISGATNQSNAGVSFTSPSQFLASPSNGQARVEAREANDIDSAQVAISDAITVSLTDPNQRFADLIFNAAIVGNVGDGGPITIDVTGLNADNTPANASITVDDDNDPLALGNGSNFYTVLATDGMLMTSVKISTDAGTSYADLRQIRLSGVVPEPTTLVLLGCAAAGLAAVRRRRS